MGKVDLKKAGWLNVAVVAANTENLNTKLESDLRAYRARYSTKIGRTSRINFWGRYEEIENQDAFVDLVAMNGLDSPYQTGYGAAPFTFYTFQDWRQSLGDDVVFNSYNRLSAYNRKIGRVGANWIWRPVRRGSLKVGYQYASQRRTRSSSPGTSDSASARESTPSCPIPTPTTPTSMTAARGARSPSTRPTTTPRTRSRRFSESRRHH
jgi:hypothetical protein